MAPDTMVNTTGLTPTDVAPSDLAIGLDFGGSGIKGAVVDVRTGQLVGDRLRVPTPQPSAPREVVVVMDGLVRRLAAPWNPSEGDAFPVGVGIPAAIRNGTTLTAANIDSAWIGFPAEREMAVAMRRTVAAGNDADVAGLAEVRFGAMRRNASPNRRGIGSGSTGGSGLLASTSTCMPSSGFSGRTCSFSAVARLSGPTTTCRI
jgi:polyphosphate glucokinase